MMMPALNRYSDWGLLVLRLAIGAIFIYHGVGKWSIPAENTNAILTILKFAEPLGGIAIVLGGLTQLAAFGLSIIMLGAIYMKATGFGQSAADFAGTFAPQTGVGWEFDLIILAACLVLVFTGAGKVSLDAMIWKKSMSMM